MFPVSMFVKRLLFVIIFCLMSEHKKDTNLLLSSLRDKKLQVCKRLSLSSPKKKIKLREDFYFVEGVFYLIKVIFFFYLLKLFIL